MAAENQRRARGRSRWLRSSLRLPRRYFFSLASDYPHKNLPNLLDAYVAVQGSLEERRAPSSRSGGLLVGGSQRVVPPARAAAAPKGVIFLGPVPAEQLRVLYKQAEALVFASLYEGFGLPPLEAMAAGTPVIAMPFSAMPEVGGDGVLYCEGLSAAALIASHGACRMRPEDCATSSARKVSSGVENFHWEKTARADLRGLPIGRASPVGTLAANAAVAA